MLAKNPLCITHQDYPRQYPRLLQHLDAAEPHTQADPFPIGEGIEIKSGNAQESSEEEEEKRKESTIQGQGEGDEAQEG